MFAQLTVVTLSLQLLLLYPDAVLSNVDGDWEYCLTNITVYRNCNATIYAIFTTTSHMCNESGFVYHIFIRHSESNDVNDHEKFGPKDPVSPAVIDGTNGQSCNVSATSVVTRAPGVYDIKFLFVAGINLKPKECHDALYIKDTIPPPTITSTDITCQGVLIKWERPSFTEVSIPEYILTVSGTTIAETISANDSTYLIPYKEGLEYDKEYNISLTAVYCGGMGDATTVSVYTALAPLIDDQADIKDSYSNLNSSHGHIYKTYKIINCEVSHPKTVTIDLNCSTSASQSSWDNHLMLQPVTIRQDNTVIVDIIIPIDSHCFVSLSFNNGPMTTPTTSSVINTDQLRSCSFSVSAGDAIVVSCIFSRFSSLWGCRVELTSNVDSNHTHIRDIAVSKGHEQFSVCNNSVYVMKCYGLTDRKIIDYGDDCSHSSVITVESGYDCGDTIVTTAAMTRATTSSSPSVNPATTITGDSLLAIVLSSVLGGGGACVIIIIIIIVAVVYILKKRRSSQLKHDPLMKGNSDESNS